MARVNTTPFEKAVCAWILRLPAIWTRPDRSQRTQTQDAALDRLVKGGFVEARLRVGLHVKGEAEPINTMWRVSGDYGRVLHQQVIRFLVAHGHVRKETRIVTGEYEAVRLTKDGELAKLDFKGIAPVNTSFNSDGTISEEMRPGIDYAVFSLVTGGPDGQGGGKPQGAAYLDSDESATPESNGRAEQEPAGRRDLLPGGNTMDPRDVEDFLNRGKADQEQDELAARRIKRAEAEVLSLLRRLSNNWQPGVDMGVDPKERQTAVTMLLWSGCVEARFGLSLYSEAPPFRAEVTATGPWQKVLLNEAQRHLGRFLRGQISSQADPGWQLRLTGEGERCQFDLQKHPENDWVVWMFVQENRVAPQIGFRLLEAPATQGNVTAVAGAKAVASVGNIVVHNIIDLGFLAGLNRQPSEETKTVVAAPKGNGKRRIPKDAVLQANIKRLKDCLEKHIKEAKDHAFSLKQSGQAPKLLPKPSKKLLAAECGWAGRQYIVTRCFQKSPECQTLYGKLDKLDALMEDGKSPVAALICPSCDERHSFHCLRRDCPEANDGRCEDCHNEAVHGEIGNAEEIIRERSPRPK